MADVNPKQALSRLVEQIPPSCRDNIVIVGSLAAAYQLLQDQKLSVRTKDVDCVVAPRIAAATKGAEVAEALLQAKWRPRGEGDHSPPGNASTPDDKLPLVRLYPPDGSDWWVEFLTVPMEEGGSQKEWTRLELSAGHFGLRAFEFMSLNAFKPTLTSIGVRCAKVEMMALANMLQHPQISNQTMSAQIAERTIKRSNKDLGRVLSIAHLSKNAVESWAESWEEGLRACFPGRWTQLAQKAGSGMRELLQSEQDLDEAAHTCTHGLLVNRNVPSEVLQFAGERVIADAVVDLERRARKFM